MSLLNIGYGLGGFMKGLNEQQNQQLLQQLSRLDLQRVQQQIQAQQQYDATAPLLYNYYLNQQEGGGQQGQPSVPQFGGGPFGGGTGAPTPPAAAQPSSPPQLGGGPTFSGIGDYGGGSPPGMGDYYAPTPGPGDGGGGGAPSPLSGPRVSASRYGGMAVDPSFGPVLARDPVPQVPQGASMGPPRQLPEFVSGGSGQYTYDSSGNLIDQVTGSPVSSVSSRAATPTTDIPPAATAPSSPPGFSGSSAAAGPPPSAGGDGSVAPMRQMYPRGGMDRVLNLIEQDESGGRNIPNYRYDAGHTAQGNFQITNTTWRETAPRAGVDINQYPTAMSAPYPVQRAVAAKLLQERGTQPWADFNPKLAADLGGGRTGGGTGGGVAAAGAGGGGGANDAILQQAMGLIQKGLAPVPESMFGNMTAHQMAVQIEKANPNADPVVKMLALERGMKMMAPEERLRTQAYMQQHQDEFRLGLAILQSKLTGERQEASAADKGWTTMQMAGPDGKQIPVRVQPSTGKVEPLNLPGGGTGLTKVGTGSQTAPTQETVDFAAKMISDYRMAPISGWALRSLYGQQVMKRVAELNPDYDATKYQRKQRGEIAFTSGRQSDSVRSFSVAIDHLAVMDDVSKALANGDVQALNQLGNEIQKQFGYAGPVDFNFAKAIVGDEVSKAVIGGVGALGDRQQLQNGFDLANSPEQLVSVIALAKRLMAGQLAGYRRQAASTGFSDKDFDNALSPRAKQELEGLGPPSNQSAPGGGQPSPSSGAPRVGDVVTGPDGKKYRVLTLGPDGQPDDVELAEPAQ